MCNLATVSGSFATLISIVLNNLKDFAGKMVELGAAHGYTLGLATNLPKCSLGIAEGTIESNPSTLGLTTNLPKCGLPPNGPALKIISSGGMHVSNTAIYRKCMCMHSALTGAYVRVFLPYATLFSLYREYFSSPSFQDTPVLLFDVRVTGI